MARQSVEVRMTSFMYCEQTANSRMFMCNATLVHGLRNTTGNEGVNSGLITPCWIIADVIAGVFMYLKSMFRRVQ